MAGINDYLHDYERKSGLIGKKVRVDPNRNTLTCDVDDLSDGVIIGHDYEQELFRCEFTFKGRRHEFSLMAEEMIFCDM